MAKKCITPDCNQQALPKKQYCFMCSMRRTFENSSKKSADRGDYLGGLLGLGASLAIDFTRDWYVNQQKQMKQQPRQRRPVRPPPKKDYFSILGLDGKTATEADVRRVQKKAAEIWHGDKGAGKAGENKLSEINEAAQECLKILRKG